MNSVNGSSLVIEYNNMSVTSVCISIKKMMHATLQREVFLWKLVLLQLGGL